MKHIFSTISAMALMLALAACGGMQSGNPTASDNTGNAMLIDGDKASWGSHTYEVSTSGNSTLVTFSNVPSGFDEFEALYNQWCGTDPYRTAAMMVWAIEIYARDEATGKQCIELINTPINATGVLRQLKQRFAQSEHAPSNDPYVQRYYAAAMLKGASAANGYRPTEPYTIELTPSVNADQETQGGKVKYIYIMGDGWDTRQRQVEVLLPNGQEKYQVFNCPSILTQCKVYTGEWQGLK